MHANISNSQQSYILEQVRWSWPASPHLPQVRLPCLRSYVDPDLFPSTEDVFLFAAGRPFPLTISGSHILAIPITVVRVSHGLTTGAIQILRVSISVADGKAGCSGGRLRRMGLECVAQSGWIQLRFWGRGLTKSVFWAQKECYCRSFFVVLKIGDPHDFSVFFRLSAIWFIRVKSNLRSILSGTDKFFLTKSDCILKNSLTVVPFPSI